MPPGISILDAIKVDIDGFEHEFQSIYMRTCRVNFDHDGVRRQFDLAIRHASVAILLWHKERKQFLMVTQFRPAIFVSRIRHLPENADKKMDEIEWPKYDHQEHGCLLELCAGLIDKDLPIIDIAREEIEEECGYLVNNDEIIQIGSFVEGIGNSGSPQHLFYSEIDESKKMGEGGGNAHEGEFIVKTWISIEEAKGLLGEHSANPVAAGVILSLRWWFQRQDRTVKEVEHTNGFLPMKFGSPKSVRNFAFTLNPTDNFFNPIRLLYRINGVSRSWDMTPRPSTVGALLFCRSTNRLVLMRKFRPAVLIARRRLLSTNKGKALHEIEMPNEECEEFYCIELCTAPSTHPDHLSLSIQRKTGYRQPRKLELLSTIMLGISQGGDHQSVYFCEVSDDDREGYGVNKDAHLLELSRSDVQSLLHSRKALCSSTALVALQWAEENWPGL